MNRVLNILTFHLWNLSVWSHTPNKIFHILYRCLCIVYTVSVLHQEEGGIGKSIPDAQDFPRPERFPEGEARGKSRGSREIWRAEGMDFPIPPEFWWSTDNLSASIFLQGVDQKILPCGQGRIDSVKINPSLLMMRDWSILPCWQGCTLNPSL